MALKADAQAAIVFLVLYAILFIFMFVCYCTGRMKWRSRFTVIFTHVTIRVAAQATYLAFGIVGYSGASILLAYSILVAEGYIVIILCAFRFLISWQIHNSASHHSWLEQRCPRGTPLLQRLKYGLSMSIRQPMAVTHHFAIIANTLIIAGGDMLVGGHKSVEEFTYGSSVSLEKAFRITGQSILLIAVIYLLYCIRRVIRECQDEGKGDVHPTLLVLLAAWPLLFIRAIYAVLSSTVPVLNYFDFASYANGGLKVNFVINEYVLGTTMEWATCVLLMSTWFTSRSDPEMYELAEKWKGGDLVVIV